MATGSRFSGSAVRRNVVSTALPRPNQRSAIIAAGFLLFGESVASARLVGALFVAATGFLLFRIVVLARCGRATGLAAGATGSGTVIVGDGGDIPGGSTTLIQGTGLDAGGVGSGVVILGSGGGVGD